MSEPRPVADRYDEDAAPAAWFVVRVTEADGRRTRERGLVRVDDLDDAPAVGEEVVFTASLRLLGDETIDVLDRAAREDAFPRVETVHQALDMRPDYEQYVREQVERKGQS